VQSSVKGLWNVEIYLMLLLTEIRAFTYDAGVGIIPKVFLRSRRRRRFHGGEQLVRSLRESLRINYISRTSWLYGRMEVVSILALWVVWSSSMSGLGLSRLAFGRTHLTFGCTHLAAHCTPRHLLPVIHIVRYGQVDGTSRHPM
jgi:hypothetical protein